MRCKHLLLLFHAALVAISGRDVELLHLDSWLLRWLRYFDDTLIVEDFLEALDEPPVDGLVARLLAIVGYLLLLLSRDLSLL